MENAPEIKRLDIVLLGYFNPKIFSPFWFVSEGLLGSKEAEAAVPEVIHSDVSIFKLDWCRLQVERNKFSIFTEQEAYFTKIFDLISGTFTLLEHTPIWALGFNWGYHFKCDSNEEWHSFGHYLVPQSPWLDMFNDPGMAKIEVTEKDKPDDPMDGFIGVRVQPSKAVVPGVYFNINHHFEISDKEKVIGCKPIVNKFIEQWNTSQEKSEKNIKGLIENFNNRGKK